MLVRAASWTDHTAPCMAFFFAQRRRGEALQLPVLLPWLRATSPGGGQLVQGGLRPCGRGLLAVLTRTICHQGLAALQQWPGMTSRLLSLGHLPCHPFYHLWAHRPILLLWGFLWGFLHMPSQHFRPSLEVLCFSRFNVQKKKRWFFSRGTICSAGL